MLTLLFVMILVALVFEFINGFHDTANSIATVVGTKVLTPRQAIALAACTNLAGALMGHAVAKTITSGLVDDQLIGRHVQQMIICAMMGGITWNLITWYFGIPSSSTHALVGGLAGASLAVTNFNWEVLYWSGQDAAGHGTGIYHKVVLPMIFSPILGLTCGFIAMAILYATLRNTRPSFVNRVFAKLQIFSSGSIGFMQGMNDAQKVMGVITMGLLAVDANILPGFLSFLKDIPQEFDALTQKQTFLPPVWVKVMCALTMAAGTACGGWRIVRTMGKKMVRLQPVHGFAAEVTAATILYLAQGKGMPVSTTHTITTSIMGVGCAKRFSALKFGLIEKIVWAWILTLPASALIAYIVASIAGAFGFFS